MSTVSAKLRSSIGGHTPQTPSHKRTVSLRPSEGVPSPYRDYVNRLSAKKVPKTIAVQEISMTREQFPMVHFERPSKATPIKMRQKDEDLIIPLRSFNKYLEEQSRPPEKKE